MYKSVVRKIIDMKKSVKAVRVTSVVVMDYDGAKLDEEIIGEALENDLKVSFMTEV